MKKFISVLFISILLIANVSFADETITEIQVNADLSANDISDNELEDDFLKIDENIYLNGKVDSNLYIIGKNVEFDEAKINGNAYVIGEEVYFKNVQISGTLYLIGNNITISGVINDAYIIGNNIRFKENFSIGRNVKILGEEVMLNGIINRNAFVSCENLNIDEKTVINGKLTVYSENEVIIPEVANISNRDLELIEKNDEKELNIVSCMMNIFSVALLTLVVSIFVIFVVRKSEKVPEVENYTKYFAKNALYGFLAVLLIPILIISSIVTVIGIKLGVIIALAYISILLLSVPIFSINVADMFTKKDEKLNKLKFIGIAILTSIIIYLVGLIEILGVLIKIIVCFIGIGCLLVKIFPKKSKKVELNEE